MDQDSAQQFFAQLAEFSRRILTQQNLPGDGSPWGTHRMGAAPKGAILHYTADSDMQRVLRWFCDPRQAAQCSAHVVVGDRKYAWAEGFDYDLPLVKALPATVVQCRRPDEVAWHATWTNAVTYGVECVNVGEVRARGDAWMWYLPRDRSAGPWTSVWKSDKAPQRHFGRDWEPFSAAQLQSTADVLRAVHALFAGSLQRPWVLGHENVQGVGTVGGQGHDKRDPGPAFAAAEVRRLVFDAAATLAPGAQGADFVQGERARAATEALGALGDAIGTDPLGQLLARSQSCHTASQPRVVAKAALRVLGYHIDRVVEPTCTPDETASVWLFQKLMGLLADGQLGPQTYDAIAARIADRFVRV